MTKEEFVQLVRSSQDGDQEAMSRLMEEIQPSVQYQCRKILGHKEDAEDAMQEILLLVCQKLGQLQVPAAFWGWLNQMTANHCKNVLVRSHPELQFWEDEEGNNLLDELEDPDEQAVPDRVIDNQETCRMVSELVDQLPPAQRICVVMRYYDEIPVKEIAAALEVPENTVKSRLNYARKAIKDGVLGYEDRGIKLYGLSPLPFLAYFLHRDAESGGMSREAVQHIVAQVIASASGAADAAGAAAGGAAAGTAAAGSGIAAGGGTAAAAGGTIAAGGGSAGAAAAAAAGKTAGIAAKAVSLKVAAIAAAGALLAGGAGGSVLTSQVVSGRAEAEIAAATEQIDAEIQAGIEAGKPQTTEDFSALLDEYIARRAAEEDSAWVEGLVNKAIALANDHDYVWADRLVELGSRYYPEDQRLLNAQEQIAQMRGVPLFDNYSEVHGLMIHREAITTADGTVHDSGNTYRLTESGIADADDDISVDLNGRYTTLTGSTGVLVYTNGSETVRFTIWGDGQILYQRDYTGIGHGQLAAEDYATEAIRLDVSGVDLLTIGFYGLNDSTEQLFGMGYGNTTIMDLALIDFEVK